MSDLRPDLPSHESLAVLGYFPDGTVTSSDVINTGATGVLLTNDGQGGSEQAVALDPVMGAVRWIHGLDDTGMCPSTRHRSAGRLPALLPAQFDGSHVWCNEPDHAVA